MDQKSLLDLYDVYYPSFEELTDEEKWNHLQNISEQTGQELPEYVPEAPVWDDLKQKPNSQFEANLKNDYEQSKLNMPPSADTPGFFNKLLGSSISEWFVENGDPLGLGSPDYWKNTHNTYAAGQWYKANYGKDKYTLDDENYDPGVLGHITSFFMGMGSPLDAASLLVGGGVGKIGARATQKGLLGKWGANTVKEMTEENLKRKVGTYNWLSGAAETGLSLGTFSSSHAALASAAEQMETTGDIKYWKVLEDAAWAGLESGIVGAVSGGIVKGPMATEYAYSKAASNPTLRDNIVKAVSNPLAQVGTEGVAFTTIPYILGEIGISPTNHPGFGEFTWEEYLKGIAINTGIIGSMKLISRAGQPKDIEAIDIVKTAYSIQRASTKQTEKSLSQMRDSILEKNGLASDELIKEITDIHIKDRKIIEEQEYIIPLMKKIDELNRKGVENWTNEEQLFYLKHAGVGDVANATMGSMKDFLKNPEASFEAYEKIKKITLSQKEKNIIRAQIKVALENYNRGRAIANDIAIGRKTFINRAWTLEDLEVSAFRDASGLNKYFIKHKENTNNFFDDIIFESKKEAQEYLNHWYETLKKEYGDGWNIHTQSKEGEEFVPITSSKDLQLELTFEEPGSSGVPLTTTAKEKIEKLQKDISAIEQVEKIQLVEVDNRGNPIYTGEGVDVPFFELPRDIGEQLLKSNPNIIRLEEAKNRISKLSDDIIKTEDVPIQEIHFESVSDVLQPVIQKVMEPVLKEVSGIKKMLKDLTEESGQTTGRVKYTEVDSQIKALNVIRDTGLTAGKMVGDKIVYDKSYLTDAGFSDVKIGFAKKSEIAQFFDKKKGGYVLKENIRKLSDENKKALLLLNKGAIATRGVGATPNSSNWNIRFLTWFQNNKNISNMKDLSPQQMIDFLYNGNFIEPKYKKGTKESIFDRGSSQDIQSVRKALGVILGKETIGGQKVAYKYSFVKDENISQSIWSVMQSVHNEINEMGPRTSAPLRGVRNKTIDLGKNLTAGKIKGFAPSEGYALAVELGARYGLRQQEINYLLRHYSPENNPIKQDPISKRNYIQLHGDLSKGDKGFRKFRTKDREIWIPDKLSESLNKFLKENYERGNKEAFAKITKDISALMFREGYSLNKDKSFNDLRARSKKEYRDEMTDAEYSKLHYVFGQKPPDSALVDPYYIKRPLKEILDYQQNIMHESKAQIKTDYEPGGLYQRTATGKPPTAADKMFHSFLQKQLKQNKGLKAKITSEDLNYAGRYHQGVIDIVLGKADMRTWFHENTHRLEDYIYSVGDKATIKLWESYKNRFKKDIEGSGYYAKYKNKKVAESEWMADNISKWAMKQEMPKSLRQRVGNFIKRLWSKTKQALFGKESLSEKDIRRVLGEKVWKGFETGEVKWGGMERFQIESALPSLEKAVRNVFQRTIKASTKGKITISEWRKIKHVIADMANIDKPKRFTFSEATPEELSLFREALETLPAGKIVKMEEFFRKVTDREGLKRLVEDSGIDNKTNISILTAVGVKDGKLESATDSQFKMYQEIINDIANDIPKNPKANIDDEIKHNILTSGGLGAVASKLTKTGLLPTIQVIEMLGLKDISSKLHSHVNMEQKHNGSFIEFEHFARGKLGKRKWEGGIGREGFQNSMWTVDALRYQQRRDAGMLTSTDKKFVEKAFTSDYRDAKKGTEFIADNYKAFTRPTYEGQIVRKYNELRVKFKDEFHDILRFILGDSEYKIWKDKNNIKWIENNIFFTRQLSKEYKEHFDPKSAESERLILAEADKIVKKKKEEYNRDKKKIDNDAIREAAYEEAVINFHNAHNFSGIKFNSPHLLSRHPKLPEKIWLEDKKKFVNTYETKWELSAKKYFLSMSKLLANMELFPEYVGIKGAKFPGVKNALSEIESLTGPDSGKYKAFVERNIRKQLGISEQGSPFDLPATLGEKTATFLAKTQLSFPTSGFKNLLLGTQMTISTYGLFGFLRGLLGTISREARNEIKFSGHTQVGIRHLDRSSKGIGFADAVFKLGLMKPTEDRNRYIAVLAGKNHLSRQVDIIKRHKPGGKYHDRAVEVLQTFYKMSEREVSLLKKHGLEGATDGKLTPAQRASLQRELSNVYQKANGMAHINTQGASLALFMPEFAGYKWVKPLTLYKRMAYAATVNMSRNARDGLRDMKAGKPGGLIKLALVATTPYVAGEAMLGLYYLLLGEDPPKENSDWWTKFKTSMWKGEFLGILSDLLSPFVDRDGLKSTMTPAIANYLLDIKTLLWDGVMADKVTFSQFSEDFSRKTFSVYNGWLKIRRKKMTPYNRGFLKFNKLWSDFEEEMPGIEDVSADWGISRNTKHYRDLRDAWNLEGPTEEFLRIFTAIKIQLIHDKMNEYGGGVNSFNQANKEASAYLKDFIKNKMNPNPAYSVGKQIKKKRINALFVKWLFKDKEKGSQYLKEIDELTKEYNKRVSTFMSLLRKSPYGI